MIKNLIFLVGIFVSPRAFATHYLVIGDSHLCGAFGSVLINDLMANGNTAEAFCAESSAARNWVRGENPAGYFCKTWQNKEPKKACDSQKRLPNIDTILGQKNYDAAVIILGTNSLLDSRADIYYKKLAEKVSGKINICYWVGPPHLRPDQAKGFDPKRLAIEESNQQSFYKSLKNSVASSCAVIDSLRLTEKNGPAGSTSDGVHRGETASTWAQGTANAILPSRTNGGDSVNVHTQNESR